MMSLTSQIMMTLSNQYSVLMPQVVHVQSPPKKYGDKLPLLSNFLSYLGRVNGGLAVDSLVEVESQSDYAGRRHSTCLRVRVKNRWTRRRMFVMVSRQVRQPVSEPIRDPVSARVPALDQ